MTNKYRIEITFVSNDRIEARVDARNKKDALRRLMDSEAFMDFASKYGYILTSSVEQEEREETIDTSRFVVSSVNGKEYLPLFSATIIFAITPSYVFLNNSFLLFLEHGRIGCAQPRADHHQPKCDKVGIMGHIAEYQQR